MVAIVPCRMAGSVDGRGRGVGDLDRRPQRSAVSGSGATDASIRSSHIDAATHDASGRERCGARACEQHECSCERTT
jgi:hypothetical protein